MPQGIIIRLRGRPQVFTSLSPHTEVARSRYVSKIETIASGRSLQSPSFRLLQRFRFHADRVDLSIGIRTQKSIKVYPTRNVYISVSSLDESKDFPCARLTCQGEFSIPVATDVVVHHRIDQETQFSRGEGKGPDRRLRRGVFTCNQHEFFLRSLNGVDRAKSSVRVLSGDQDVLVDRRIRFGVRGRGTAILCWSQRIICRGTLQEPPGRLRRLSSAADSSLIVRL